MYNIILLLAVISLTGCSFTVKDYDGGKLEREQISKIKAAQMKSSKAEPTPEYVKVADSDDVIVEVNKTKPIKGAQGITLDVWKVSATNNSDYAKCVKIDWKLMDFNFETTLPYEFLVNSKQIIKVGTMTQNIWSFSETAVALPPSGYVDKFNVRDAEFDEKTKKFTCDMVEADIDEPK